MFEEEMRHIGVLIDVTDEMSRQQRLEFERNYDSLTKLLNRQGFLNKAFTMIKSNEDKIGIMMFADLDDLKFVNDMYGHEMGDEYIRAFAGFLNRFKECKAIVGRISGDEFVLFMNGFATREEARNKFDEIFSDIKNCSVKTPGGMMQKLRVSVGLAYYPDDSRDIKKLVEYADYAMYDIKHTIKGATKEFDLEDYNKNSFVIKMKDVLNILIEDRKLTFVFQPVIDVRTGEIYAYEALMRSMMPELKSPDEILRVARSQSKLYQIEKLTFEIVLDWMQKNRHRIGDKRIFVNSVPNQVFTDEDLNEMRNTYGDLFGKIVLEITENEFSGREEIRKKIGIFRKLGAKVAIDDYGSGYSNTSALLTIEPNFLKIDMSIIRDIDKDSDKQHLVESIIAYASKKNMKIIAEGVESIGEMSTVIKLGVDYIQGFYFAVPDFELMEIPAQIKEQVKKGGML
jgi:diguanylate cyclase (GGDEF)-like protein